MLTVAGITWIKLDRRLMTIWSPASLAKCTSISGIQFGLAIIGHLDRVHVDPFGDFVVLEELSHDVVFEEVGNITFQVTMTLPTFEVSCRKFT